ncbi:MAG: CheY-like chemotaxis protein/signal transduction histidine kinase [Sulfurimonas sp.]|jgi:CheY-like chemotaxis protein/signal transduction histidine kinase|uniref:response regulator n=1 Tax=Sulfurimonas sp. TaxID=2022749 RepID=UPI0039E6E78C
MQKIIFLLILLTISLCATVNFNLQNIDIKDESFSLWIALFSLALLAMLALFFSSEQIRRLKKKNENENRIQEDIDIQENQILTNMSENIQDLASTNVDIAKKLAQANDTNQELKTINKSENKLLSISTNLIEFLRLKSHKVTIHQEEFSFSNLLNDISGTIKEIIKETPLELHYILKDNLNENIYADTLNLSKILSNIILYSVQNNASKVLVYISNTNAYSKENNLFFRIETDLKVDIEDPHQIFSSQYNEETDTYKSLGLFIARELCSLMGGELIARNDRQGNLEFIFDIGYKESENDSTSHSISCKNILIVDFSKESILCAKNIFHTLGHRVTSLQVKNTFDTLPNFSQFNIIVLGEKLCVESVLKQLSRSNKLICLSNLFGNTHNENMRELKPKVLKNPLTKKHVENTITSIYSTPNSNDKNHPVNIPIYKSIFKDTPDITLHQFSKFRETNILLVEDNFINQKVLLGILSKSGINIEVANHGQEALDMLKQDTKFHLVLMDINMPVMDGYTASQHIRNDQKFDTLPIVALTALTSPQEIESMFESGMNAYLAKPLKKEKLFSALSMFILDKKDDRRKDVRYEERVLKLDGLNIKIGIQNSNTNEFFYQEILCEFKDAYGDSDQIFTKLVEDFRYEQLRMLCLDIRGLSASIGAQDLNLLTVEVLKLLVFRKYDILKDFVPRYAKSLNRLNNSIEKYVS